MWQIYITYSAKTLDILNLKKKKTKQKEKKKENTTVFNCGGVLSCTCIEK